MTVVGTVLAGGVAAVVAALRWLLVAQREHYLGGAALRFAARWWWQTGIANRGLFVLAAGSALASFAQLPMGFVAAGIIVAAPLGFPLRGRAPGPLAWTRRLRTLAAIVAALYVVVVFAGWALGAAGPVAVAAALLLPAITDAALVIVTPVERRLARRWVDRATVRLRQVAPTVVGITGSYGKTSTKNYVAHLTGSNRSVVASPRSYNNAAGLAIAVNEHLVPGAEVFVAEMGTYGPGEIAAMVEWVRPSIAVITAIGPVHLERFRSEERIVAAKSEILAGAEVAVLNVDDERLAAVATELEDERGIRVVRCSAVDVGADVCARREDAAVVIYAAGAEVARAASVDAHPGNVACAVAVALELGTPAQSLPPLLASLPAVPNRLTAGKASTGATVLDDTFNSNPAGAVTALETARRHATPGGKLGVITPGMVELGPRQHAENVAFARAAAASATHLVVVGRTNVAALTEGAQGSGVDVIVVASRDDAAAWVRENTGAGDVVLWENDLPDHYP